MCKIRELIEYLKICEHDSMIDIYCDVVKVIKSLFCECQSACVKIYSGKIIKHMCYRKSN